MATEYISLFDRDMVITKADMCELLNLDLTRPGLVFSAAEIEKAYRLRSRQFHPDRQHASTQKIPNELCNILMNDIAQAKEHLLKGEDNIPGKAFKEKNPESVIATVITALNALRDGTPTISRSLYWINFFSNSFFVMPVFATFSDNQLNFRYVAQYSQQLKMIQPFFKNINGRSLAKFLHYLKDQLNDMENFDGAKIKVQLRVILPETLVTEEELDALITAIKETGDALKNLLTDSFIKRAKGLVNFWARLIATLPSWGHIFSVYFISLFFTANSLPKYFNVQKVISELIIHNKGIAQFIFLGIPMILFAELTLPFVMAWHLSFQLLWIAFKAVAQVAINGFNLLFIALSLPFTSNKDMFVQKMVSLLESIINVTIRLTLTVIIETLDAISYMLTNTHQLGFVLASINAALDWMLAYLRPATAQKNNQLAVVNAVENQQDSSSPVAQEISEEASSQPPSASAHGFFARPEPKLHNTADSWLNNLFSSLQSDVLEEEIGNGAPAFAST